MSSCSTPTDPVHGSCILKVYDACQDKAATKDWGFDTRRWLEPEADSPTSADWTVPAGIEPAGLELIDGFLVGKMITMSAAGIVGVVYRITAEITTAKGKTDIFAIDMKFTDINAFEIVDQSGTIDIVGATDGSGAAA